MVLVRERLREVCYLRRYEYAIVKTM